jgi:hypothetical protein
MGPPTAPPAGATAPEDDSDAIGTAEQEPDEEAKASGAGAEVSLDELVRVWPAVLDNLRQNAPALAATFEGARPVGVEEGGVKIGFPAEFTFNKRKAEAPDKREVVAAAIEAVLGTRLTPIYALLDGEGGGEGKEVDHEEMVERLKSEFDAEEVG